MLVELSALDIKVLKSALHTIADVDLDWLIAATKRQTPAVAHEDVSINCAVSQMVAKDLLAALTEVQREMKEKDS